MPPTGSRPTAVTGPVTPLGVVPLLQQAPELLEMVRGAAEVAARTGRVLLLADVLRYAAGRVRHAAGRDPEPAEVDALVVELLRASVPHGALSRATDDARQALGLVDLVDLHPDQGPGEGGVHGVLSLEGPAAEYLTRLLAGDGAGALRYVRELLADGMPLGDLLVDVLEKSEVAVGAMWSAGEASIAEEHFCTSVTERALAEVYASLFTGRRTGPRLLAAHATHSLQNIGLRMVCDLLEAHGWTTSYLGGFRDQEQLVEVLDTVQPDVLALSGSLAGHVVELMDLIAHLREHDVHRDLPIVVGGRPFLLDPGLVEAIGADGTARDARAALELCTLLVEGGR